MKTPFGSLRLPASRTKVLVCAAIALLGLFVFLGQLWRCHALWTTVGFVDTWPLYNRLMQWRQGQISLDHYFFDPHGPHLHFIVYLLYLIDVTLGTGRQLVPHFATLFSIIGVIATLSFFFLRSLPPESRLTVRTCALLFGAMILLSGISQATMIPFQTVVITTRFVYFLLLAILLWCQLFPNRWLHISALAASCLAASFYAAGGIFAVEVLAIHLMFYRRRRALLVSWIPLATYLCLMHHYIKPAIEMQTVAAIVRGLNIKTAVDIAKGTACYYASTLTIGWPRPPQNDFGASEYVLVIIGAIVCAVTIAWAVYVLISISLKLYRGQSLAGIRECADCLMALLSVFVFISAVSAAVLWLARGQIFGPAFGMSPFFAVLTSTRYAAFGGVAFVILLYILQRVDRYSLGAVLAVAVFLIVAVCGADAVVRLGPAHYAERDGLENAATAILMGISPADREADAVWPGVAGDQYWRGQLPKLAAYLNAGRISYAYGMPALGQFSPGPGIQVFEYTLQPVPQSGNACRLIASTASFDSAGWVAPSRLFPVTTVRGEVVGYAARDGATVRGHLTCPEAGGHPALFLSGRD